MTLDKLVFLDVETTGMSDEDRLCQLAAKKHDGKIWYDYYKPPVPVSLRAMSVNHITNEMLENCPPFEGSHAQEILKAHAESDHILVAHNASFDCKFLEREGITFKYVIDTMKVSRFLETEGVESHGLQYLRYFYGIKLDGVPHSAEGDVEVLEAVFNELYKEIPDLVRMIEISK